MNDLHRAPKPLLHIGRFESDERAGNHPYSPFLIERKSFRRADLGALSANDRFPPFKTVA